MPLFSIVIPTRNRARYLQFALQSCIEQEFDDYEIVVSDNNSTDDTAKLVSDLDNGKVRYFHTGKDLSVTDNFEFGVSNATGKYVLLLADDEAYKPTALRKLKRIIDATSTPIISFGRTSYVFPGAGPNGTGNFLNVRPFTRNVVKVPVALALHHIFSLVVFEDYYFGRALPLSVKSVVHRDVIEGVKQIAGRFQLPPTPDWSSCVMMLSQVESLVLLDEHLNIAGFVPESTGPMFKKTRTLDAATMQDSAHLTDLTPLPSHTLYNTCINAILNGQRAVSPRLDPYHLDMNRYISLIHEELLYQESSGVDITDDLRALYKLAPGFKSLSFQLSQHRSYCSVRNTLGCIKQKVSSLIGHRSNKVSSSQVHNWPIRIDGSSAGFNNILECARRYDEMTNGIQSDAKANALFQAAYGSCEPIVLD